MVIETSAGSHATRILTDGLVLSLGEDAPLGDTHNTHRVDSVPVSTDPRIDDAPQLGSKTEWWYLQAHLRDASSGVEDPRHTVIVCIFRQAADAELDPEVEHNWAVIYATLDWETQKYTTYSKVPPSMPGYALKSLEGNDSLLSKTIQSMVKAGPGGEGVPPFVPDGLFTSPVQIRRYPRGDGPALHLDWDDGASLVGGNGSYRLVVPEMELDVRVRASKPLMLHGNDGETLSDKQGCMFYYSWPRTEAAGAYRGDEVVGTAWVDHEYSLGTDGTRESPSALSFGWSWFSLLTSGARAMEISVTQVVKAGGVVEQYVVYLDESGRRHRESEFTLRPSEPWVSGHTFQKFDTCWRLRIPAVEADVEIVSVTRNQEFQTWLRMPSFYEGAVRFSGTWEGAAIGGFGAMELVKETTTGAKFMEQTLSNATALVREEAETWIPSSVRANHFQHVTGVRFDGEEERLIQERIVDAFYMLNRRGGKNWRPMLFGAAVGLVGGDANDWRSFLVVPELMHTASLIIDDVEDGSEARRGGPCVHRVLGVPAAINAGCALYFWGETIVRDNALLTDAQRRHVYSMYFDMMRVGHAGQALDIAGLAMDRLPSLAEAEALLARVVNLHRCKSGIPASFCGAGGALLGGGTAEQMDAVGAHVRNLGIAFQIRDDVLDVLGKVPGKNAADDLRDGKMTYPVARLFTLDHPDRAAWFAHWQARDVAALVDALESSGAMAACGEDVRRWARDGWARVDALTPASFSKVLFRMFAAFLVEQHY